MPGHGRPRDAGGDPRGSYHGCRSSCSTSRPTQGAAATLDALTLGASDCVMKPDGAVPSDAATAGAPRRELVSRRSGCAVPSAAIGPCRRGDADDLPRATAAPAPPPRRRAGDRRVDRRARRADGSHSQLPARLSRADPDRPAHAAGVHEAAGRAARRQVPGFASPKRQLHQVLAPGRAWIAPGDFHMAVERDGDAVRSDDPQELPENSCRPAVDVLFRSVASVYGPHVLAVVMTGMGQDGVRGCEEIRAAGGQIIVQDEASSVVWGMPGFVVKAGLADQVAAAERAGRRDHRSRRGMRQRRSAAAGAPV